MRYSKGVMWLDDCRIPFVDERDLQKRLDEENSRKSDKIREGFSKTKAIPNLEQQGRFTPNLLVCDDMLNDGSVSKGNKPAKRNKNYRYSMDYGLKVFDGMDIIGYADTGSSSRFYDLDMWFDKMIESL